MEKSTILGLTGQTGAGKSTVSKIFEEDGWSVINADEVARVVVEKGTMCLEEIAAVFGNGVLNEDGTLNRRELAFIVFNSRRELERLNYIMFPHIIKEINRRIAELKNSGAELILLDAPTLFESGADRLCNIVVSVVASPDTRMERIVERDGLTVSEARSRINSQPTVDFYLSGSDYTISNIGGLDELIEQAKATAAKIREVIAKVRAMEEQNEQT